MAFILKPLLWEHCASHLQSILPGAYLRLNEHFGKIKKSCQCQTLYISLQTKPTLVNEMRGSTILKLSSDRQQNGKWLTTE